MNIVILHGWGHSGQMWDSFAAKFHGHKVLALDLPGFGKEKLISENWDIANHASWVVKKLQTKNIKNSILIGHSFGGKIATEIAINNPQLVNKLILIASPVLRRPSLSSKTKIMVHKVAKRVLFRNAMNIFTNEEYKDAHKNKMGRIFVNSVNYDASDRLGKIKVPTLIIWGESDRDAPLFIGKHMHEMIKGSKLEILKNTGHNLQLENPNILFGLVNNFINA